MSPRSMISKGQSSSPARFVFRAVSEEAKQWLLFLFRSMDNKTIISFGFCDIQNNQDLGKGYHNHYLDLDYSWYHKNLIQ